MVFEEATSRKKGYFGNPISSDGNGEIARARFVNCLFHKS